MVYVNNENTEWLCVVLEYDQRTNHCPYESLSPGWIRYFSGLSRSSLTGVWTVPCPLSLSLLPIVRIPAAWLRELCRRCCSRSWYRVSVAFRLPSVRIPAAASLLRRPSIPSGSVRFRCPARHSNSYSVHGCSLRMQQFVMVLASQVSLVITARKSMSCTFYSGEVEKRGYNQQELYYTGLTNLTTG